MTTKVLSTAALITLLITLGGCATTNNPLYLLRGQPHVATDLVSTMSTETQPRADDCYVDVVLDRSPERPYIVIGRATAVYTTTDRRALSTTDSNAIPHLRAEACRAGGHVLFDVASNYHDQWIPRTSSTTPSRRNLMVRSIHSTALVAVYVGRNGSVLAPPSGPRRVIRVPAQVEQGVGMVDEVEDDLTWDQGIADPWAVPAP